MGISNCDCLEVLSCALYLVERVLYNIARSAEIRFTVAIYIKARSIFFP